MKLVLNIILLVMAVTNISLHCLGSYLMISLYRSGKQKTEQMIYMINLSITEIVINVMELTIRYIPQLITIPKSDQDSVKTFKRYASILYFTCISMVFYLTMIYITVDRLFEILLNIKYPVYWNTTKAKWLIFITWFVGFAIFVCMSVTYSFTGNMYAMEFSNFLQLPLDFLFLILAIVVHGFIFHKFKQSRVTPSHSGMTPTPSAWKVFLNSRFYVSVLLILSFLVFMVIPDLVRSFLGIFQSTQDNVSAMSVYILYVTLFMYEISILCDAWIYIFLQRSARALLYKKLGYKRQENPFLPQSQRPLQKERNARGRDAKEEANLSTGDSDTICKVVSVDL